MSSACLVFALYMNQMSHLKMFPTSHLMTMRTRNQTKFRYIFVPYVHVLVPFRVPLWICILLILRNLLIIIHTSVNFRFFISYFCFLLYFPNLYVLFPSLFLTLNILLSFLSPHRCITMTQYTFQYLISLVYHAEIIRSLWMLIFVRVRSKSQFTIGFFQIILC